MAVIEDIERPYPRPLSGVKGEHLPSLLCRDGEANEAARKPFGGPASM